MLGGAVGIGRGRRFCLDWLIETPEVCLMKERCKSNDNTVIEEVER